MDRSTCVGLELPWRIISVIKIREMILLQSNEECGAKSQAAVNLWIISDQTIIIKPILCNGSWLDNGNYSAWCCEAARVLPEAITCSDTGILFSFWHNVLFLFFAHHVLCICDILHSKIFTLYSQKSIKDFSYFALVLRKRCKTVYYIIGSSKTFLIITANWTECSLLASFCLGLFTWIGMSGVEDSY